METVPVMQQLYCCCCSEILKHQMCNTIQIKSATSQTRFLTKFHWW